MERTEPRKYEPVFCQCGAVLFEVLEGTEVQGSTRHVCRECRRRVTVLGTGTRLDVGIVDMPRKRVR